MFFMYFKILYFAETFQRLHILVKLRERDTKGRVFTAGQ